MDLEQLFNDRVTTVGTSVIDTAIAESAAQWNAQINALTGLLVQRTTDAQRRYLIPGSGTLQPMDEHGNPLPVMPGGYYDIAFPIQGGGTAYGDNRVTRALQTVGEVNRYMVDAQARDADWMRRHILAAILDNTTWTYADPELGNLTIQPLANNDAVTYPLMGGAAPAAAQHYVAQVAAIADATNPYGTIYSTLTRYPSQSGSAVVAYIPTGLVATTSALATFTAVNDPRVIPGANTARLSADGGAFLGPGSQVLGMVQRVWIVEWPALPASTILAVAVDADPVVAMREYPAPELQGLFRETHSADGNHAEYRFLRYAGFGVQNRIGAMVYQVSNGDTTYDIPTGYATPLPV